jgi:hypothetical protein
MSKKSVAIFAAALIIAISFAITFILQPTPSLIQCKDLNVTQICKHDPMQVTIGSIVTIEITAAKDLATYKLVINDNQHSVIMLNINNKSTLYFTFAIEEQFDVAGMMEITLYENNIIIDKHLIPILDLSGLQNEMV